VYSDVYFDVYYDEYFLHNFHSVVNIKGSTKRIFNKTLHVQTQTKTLFHSA
jgi:hypothetical protein